MNATLKTGLSVAAAAAALFATTAGVTTAAAADGMVKCSGVNSCKGTSECKTAKSDCKGHNSCRARAGSAKKSADECTKAGGKVEKVIPGGASRLPQGRTQWPGRASSTGAAGCSAAADGGALHADVLRPAGPMS